MGQLLHAQELGPYPIMGSKLLITGSLDRKACFSIEIWLNESIEMEKFPGKKTQVSQKFKYGGTMGNLKQVPSSILNILILKEKDQVVWTPW